MKRLSTSTQSIILQASMSSPNKAREISVRIVIMVGWLVATCRFYNGELLYYLCINQGWFIILNAGVMWTCNRLLMIITELSPM